MENQRIKQLESPALKKLNEVLVFPRRKIRKQKDHTPVAVCIPWEQKRKEIAGDVENEEILRRIWQDNESLAHTFIWHCLVSF